MPHKKTFWQVCRRLWHRYCEHRVPRSAAELTYYLLFSFFPLIIFVNSIVGMLDISGETVLARLSLVLPRGVVETIVDYLDYVGGMNKSLLFYAGSVLTVYMLFQAMISLSYAVRVASGTMHTRSMPRMIMSLIISIVLMALMFALLLLLSVSEELYGYIEVIFSLGAGVGLAANLIKYAAGPLIMFIILTLYYYLMGNRGGDFKYYMPGACLATLLWYALSILFGVYVNEFVNFGVLYGSLASIIILMMWMHTTCVAFIVGAELNAVLLEE